MIIKGTMVLFLLLLAAPLIASGQTTPPKSDPFQYEARMADEAKQYMSNCSGSINTGCSDNQKAFAAGYYEAFEGDTDYQWETGIFFMRGAQYGVNPDPVLACAWWLVTAKSGGTYPPNLSVQPFSILCGTIPGAQAAAAAIETEMAKVGNLTY